MRGGSSRVSPNACFYPGLIGLCDGDQHMLGPSPLLSRIILLIILFRWQPTAGRTGSLHEERLGLAETECAGGGDTWSSSRGHKRRAPSPPPQREEEDDWTGVAESDAMMEDPATTIVDDPEHDATQVVTLELLYR